MADSENVLHLKGIDKRFPGVQALKGVDFELRRGEVHALVGENGAGKSTLIKILAGIYQPSAGDIVLNGRKMRFSTPKQAEKNGISVVHQELNCFNYMSVAENIFAGHMPAKGARIDYKRMYLESLELLRRFELDKQVDVKQNIGELNLAKQQIIEIIRAVAQDAHVIVFDEPTSALTEHEVDILNSIINDLKKSEISVIYISHRLDEIFGLADRVTVLKDGEYVKTLYTAETTKEEIVRLMVGRDVETDYEAGTSKIGDPILEVKHFSDGKNVRDISFVLHKGEVLGLGGLEGAGRTELVEMIFGLRKRGAGELKIRGARIEFKNSREAVRQGLAYITKDRKSLGLFIGLDILHNIAAVGFGLGNFVKKGLVGYSKMRKTADSYVDAFAVKTPSLEQLVLNLSGGNQQKVLLSMWLTANPDIIIVDEPTRGVDVGAKREIHRILRNLAKEGKAILMVSSDLPELITASDNILVIYEGKVTGYISHAEVSEELVMHKASGL